MSRKPSLSIPALPLFPFQAVLCCTMGALILILIVINRHSRAQAMTVAKAVAAKTAQSIDEITAQREMLDWQLQQLGVSRQQAESQLTDRRVRLAGIEDQIRELRLRLQSLQGTLQSLASGTQVNERRQATQAELIKLQAEISQAESDLILAREKAQKTERSFAIVPYVGPNQTRRRPIYIECRDNRIILQPEGIELVPGDFKRPDSPDNPLALSLRTARERIAEIDRTHVEKLGEPYPLLIVRPDGIAAYYAARAAMRSWGADFGYEFVEQDWKLKYPPADAELLQREALAVEEARVKSRIAAIGGLGVSRGRATYRAGYEGVVRDGGQSNDDEFADDRFAPKSNLRSRADATGAPATVRPAGYSGAGGMNAGGMNAGGMNAGGMNAGGMNAGGTNAGGTNAGGTNAGGTNAGGMNAGGTFAGGGSPSNAGGSLGNAAPTANGGTGPSLGDTANASNPDGSGNNNSAKPRGPADPYAFTRDAGGSVKKGSSGEPADGAPSGTSMDYLMQPDQHNADSADKTNRKMRSLAESRGANWGITGPAQKQVAVTRPVRIQCSGDRLTIMSDSGQNAVKTISFQRQTEDSIDDLVLAVREVVRNWGTAGRNMYWRPQLLLEIGPSGEGRFYELQSLLENSGLEVVRKSN